MRTLPMLTVGAATLAMLAATPAAAQSRYEREDNTGRNVAVGAVVGALAGALLGDGDGTYIAGGAVAGAALGAVASNRGSGCEYYRNGQCYRSQSQWDRDQRRHYRQDNRYDRRDYRRDDRRRYDRDYRYDRRW